MSCEFYLNVLKFQPALKVSLFSGILLGDPRSVAAPGLGKRQREARLDIVARTMWRKHVCTYLIHVVGIIRALSNLKYLIVSPRMRDVI